MYYRKMTEDEKEYAAAMANRSASARERALTREDFNGAAMGVVQEKPWTFVEIQNGVSGHGFSKQCQYRPCRDEWIPEVGLKIALARAARDYDSALEVARRGE